MEAKYCNLRKDLKELELGIQLSDDHPTYWGEEPLEYRWLKEGDGFQVFYVGMWLDAESIDFDF